MARLEGLEPPTLCFEGRCSIQLSYRRVRAPLNPTIEPLAFAFVLREPLTRTPSLRFSASSRR
jgi:hypothetical protein